MTRLNASNLGKTQITSDNGTTIEVQDASVFPDAPFRVVATDVRFDLTLSDIEIIEVGQVTNNTLESLDRGLEGTTEQSWSSGDIIENRTTSGLLEELYDEVDSKTDYNSDDFDSDFDGADISRLNNDENFTDYDSSDFNTDFSNKDTDDLSEGTGNLYYTDSRVDSHISGGTGIDYSLGTIELTSNGHDNSQHSESYITDYTVTNSDLTGLNISELNNDEGYITDYTNNYVNSISGDGNSTLTLGREGLGDLTQDLSHNHDALYDDYGSWILSDGTNTTNIGSGNIAEFSGSGLISVSESAGTITISTDANDYSLESHDNTYHDVNYTDFDSGDVDTHLSGGTGVSYSTGTISLTSNGHNNSQHSTNYTTTSASDVTSSNWGDYEIQKNGTDGSGIINFKTE